jgi:hypothetical protein
MRAPWREMPPPRIPPFSALRIVVDERLLPVRAATPAPLLTADGSFEPPRLRMR